MTWSAFQKRYHESVSTTKMRPPRMTAARSPSETRSEKSHSEVSMVPGCSMGAYLSR
jgi:hypothetical protein